MIPLKKLFTTFFLPLSTTVLDGITIYYHTTNDYFQQKMMQATFQYSTQDYKESHLLCQ